jgi:hypothetical protein
MPTRYACDRRPGFQRLFDDSSLLSDRSPPFSLLAWVSHQGWPARMCPSIPRGHLSMCPHRAASLFTLASSRRLSPVAYVKEAGRTAVYGPPSVICFPGSFETPLIEHPKSLKQQNSPKITMRGSPRAKATFPVSALLRSCGSQMRAFRNPAVEQPANEVIPRANQHGHQEHEA